MAIKNSVYVYIDGINRTPSVVLPLKTGNFLDERLDECRLSLRAIKKKNFAPLTPVEVIINNEFYLGTKETRRTIKTRTETKHFIVANDNATETQIGSGLYNHDLYLIEVTKIAECVVVDTLTFTNDLGRNYTENAKFIGPTGYKLPYVEGKGFYYTTYKNAYLDGTIIKMPSATTLAEGGAMGAADQPKRKITFPSGKIINDKDENGAKLILTELGVYQINYTGGFAASSTYNFTYTFNAVENKLPLKPWTITEVINRTLDLAEPIRQGEKPRFKLNAKQAELFDKILAPQFSFTKQTLRECLQEIGKVVHGEPRLEPKKDEDGKWYYEVSYDMFAAQEKSGIWTKPYILKTVSQVIDSYTAWLDSNAENLVNQLDKYSGVIIEPYRGGAKTVRTENLYVRIEAGNMIIPTQYPIYTVDKLEYVYVENNELKSVDLTPWLFERSIYDTELSSYAEQYPYSKAYALWFSQGSKNIQGLNFKVDSAVAAVFKNYAIVNILHQAISSGYNVPEYPTMAFRITYTPFYNARVAQTKPNYKEFNRPAALIFNQQANIVESRYYGENLKGAVARIGNIDLSLTYRLYLISDIPQAGQMYDDNYYISAVSVEYLPTCILCTIGLSRDFNRLSAYIGINSEKRYSEVSQTQAVERNTLWREYIVVGNAEQADEDSLIGAKMICAIAATFTQDGDYLPLTNVVAWGQSYNGNDLNVVNLPVISSAFGNSISFSWTYEDNYSAGAISHYENKKDGAQGYFQNNYPYNDYYGRIYYYNLDIQPAGEQLTAGTLKDIGKDLPKGTKPPTSSGYLSTIGKTPFVMRKDNREVLQCNFQIDFVTNTDIIIGSALASYCPAVRSTDKKFIKEETFSNGEVYIGSNGQIEPYEMGKTYRVLVDNMTCVNAFVESRVDETSPANDEYYLVISEYSNYKNFQGTAKVYEGTLTARLYVFPTELNKFTDHIEAWEDVKLWQLSSEEVQVFVSNNQFWVQAAKFPASGKSWAIVTAQSDLPEETVEDERGEPYQLVQTIGGDLLIGQNKEVTAGQAFMPIYFTQKREIFDRTVWKDNL